MKNSIVRKTISTVMLVAFFGIQVFPAYSYQNLSGWLLSDGRPMRGTGHDIAGELEPGAIGNGRPLVQFLKDGIKSVPAVEIKDESHKTIVYNKLRESIELAIQLYLANASKLPIKHKERIEMASNELTQLKDHLAQKIYLFNAVVEGNEDYLLGFNYEGKIGLSIELIDLLYAISPKLLAQYIYHECVPEHLAAPGPSGAEVDRESHREVYNEIQEPIYGAEEVANLGSFFRNFITDKVNGKTIRSYDIAKAYALIKASEGVYSEFNPYGGSAGSRVYERIVKTSLSDAAKAIAYNALSLLTYSEYCPYGGSYAFQQLEEIGKNSPEDLARAIAQIGIMKYYSTGHNTGAYMDAIYELERLAENSKDDLAKAIAYSGVMMFYSTGRNYEKQEKYAGLFRELGNSTTDDAAKAFILGSDDYTGAVEELMGSTHDELAKAIGNLYLSILPQITPHQHDAASLDLKKMVSKSETPYIADEVRLKYRAELFKNNLVNTILQNPDKVFGIVLDTELGDHGADNNQDQAIKPIWDAIKEVQTMLKSMSYPDGRAFDKNFKVVWGKGSNGQLAREIENLGESVSKENLFMVLKEGNINNFTAYQDISWITAIDDSKLTDLLAEKGAYIPIFESITLSIMTSQNADDESIKALYDAMSDKPITLEKLNAMLSQRVIRILPKMNYMSLKALRDENEAIARVYLSA